MKSADPILQEISVCLERNGIDDAAVREAMIASLLQAAQAVNPPSTPPVAEIDQEIWGLCLEAANQPLMGSDGSPLILYHGTDREFDKFDSSLIGANTGSGFVGRGFYFTDSERSAKNYGERIMTVHLRMKNPAQITGNVEHDIKSLGLLELSPRRSDYTFREIFEMKDKIAAEMGKIELSPRDLVIDAYADYDGRTYAIRGLNEHGAKNDEYVRSCIVEQILYAKYGMPNPGNLGSLGNAISPALLTQQLIENGYDGIIADGTDLLALGTKEYVVFRAEQISLVHDKNIDSELVERLFGSDEVIGVCFRLSQASGDEEVISSTEFDARFGHLDHTAMPDTESLMPDGSSAVCCTNYAHYVRSTLGALGHQVQVVGFANEDNPTSRCAIDEFHPGGHDFAIVDSRYLVDPWVRLVAGVEDQIFYDLNNSDDAKKAHEIYGPRSLWLPLPYAEVYQPTEAPKLQNDNQKGTHHDQDNYCYQ